VKRVPKSARRRSPRVRGELGRRFHDAEQWQTNALLQFVEHEMRRVGGDEREVRARSCQPIDLACEIIHHLRELLRREPLDQLRVVDAVDDQRRRPPVWMAALIPGDQPLVILDRRLRPSAADNSKGLHGSTCTRSAGGESRADSWPSCCELLETRVVAQRIPNRVEAEQRRCYSVGVRFRKERFEERQRAIEIAEKTERPRCIFFGERTTPAVLLPVSDVRCGGTLHFLPSAENACNASIAARTSGPLFPAA
jgi:hypothetical protein